MIRCDRGTKWRPLIVVCVAFLLALGACTPLFGFLYAWVPGFDRFRSISTFSFLASLLLCLLAASGLDRLFRQKRIEPPFIAAVFAGAAALGVGGWWIASNRSWPGRMNAWLASSQPSVIPQHD